jgi:glycine/D-amino acid oxidase-like deaminating enzyme
MHIQQVLCRHTGVCPPHCDRLPGIEGAYVATGHSCWGILNAPATGEALAQLIVTGRASSVDLRAFDPARCAGAPRRW